MCAQIKMLQVFFSDLLQACFAKLYGFQHSDGDCPAKLLSLGFLYVHRHSCLWSWLRLQRFSCGKMFRGQSQESHCIFFVSSEIITIVSDQTYFQFLSLSVPSSSQTSGTEKSFWVMKNAATKISHTYAAFAKCEN